MTKRNHQMDALVALRREGLCRKIDSEFQAFVGQVNTEEQWEQIRERAKAVLMAHEGKLLP